MFMAYLNPVEDVLKLIQLAFNYIFRIWPTLFLTWTITVACKLMLLIFSIVILHFILGSAVSFLSKL